MMKILVNESNHSCLKKDSNICRVFLIRVSTLLINVAKIEDSYVINFMTLIANKIISGFLEWTWLLPRVGCVADVTQNMHVDAIFYLSISSFLWNIMDLRHRKNNTGYHILRIGYQSIFYYLDNLIPYIVLPISWLPDVTE